MLSRTEKQLNGEPTEPSTINLTSQIKSHFILNLALKFCDELGF